MIASFMCLALNLLPYVNVYRTLRGAVHVRTPAEVSLVISVVYPCPARCACTSAARATRFFHLLTI